MKLAFLFLSLLAINPSFATVENINLNNGESIILGEYRVSCAGTTTQVMYKCTAGMNGPSYSSDWRYDREDAREEAKSRCRAANGQGCSASSCRSRP